METTLPQIPGNTLKGKKFFQISLMQIKPFRSLHISSNAKRLLASRALRSIAQGALTVDAALYLNALGWTGAEIGGLLSGIGIFNAALGIVAGPLSDRKGRRPLLLVYQIVLFVSTFILIFTANPVAIVIAGLLIGMGRGANGAAGPFGPVEQAWLAREIQSHERAKIYSLNSSIGFYGMALGALIAGIPAIVTQWLEGPLAYRPLFAIACLTSVLGFFLLYGAHDEAPFTHTAPNDQGTLKLPPLSKRIVTPPEKEALWRLFGMNSLNSAAIGLTGPLISYWFLMKFHVGPGVQGPILALTLLFTAFSATINGRLAEKVGLIKAVVWSRSLGLIMLVLLPVMPFYWLAATLYLLRSVFNRGTVGTRQAMIPGMVSPENQGLAFSISSASAQLPQAIGPMIAGPLIAAEWLETPFYISAVLQAFYVGLYSKAFGKYDIPQHSSPAPASEADPKFEPDPVEREDILNNE